MHQRLMRNARTIRTWSVRGCWLTGGLAVLFFAGWFSELLPNTRPVLALYFTLVMVAGACFCSAVTATLSMAVHQAFSAGYQTGQASVWPDDAETRPAPGEDPLLRLVE